MERKSHAKGRSVFTGIGAAGKNTILYILSVLLAAGGCLTACGGDVPADTEDTGTVYETNTTAPETTTVDPRMADELPADVKYDGEDFVVMGREKAESAVAWLVEDIATEEENGERINDAVYARNLAMNERFGVTVKQELVSEPPTVLQNRIAAGEDTVDLAQDTLHEQGRLIVGGYTVEMSALEYLNFDKAWWDTMAVRGLSIAGRIYTAFGSGQLNAMKATWATLFNKKLADDAGLPDLYQVVRDGKWTLDTLITYGQAITRDVNGDGVMEWGTDIFGIGIETEINAPLLMGTGEQFVTFREDGSYEFTMVSPTMVDAAETIWQFMHTGQDQICNVRLVESSNRWVEYRAHFAADRFGFMLNHLGVPVLVGGNMQSDFGVLPFPKVFEEQEEYISGIQYESFEGLIIPKSVQDTVRTALLSEAYQMLAYNTVREAYYDYILTFRAARDEESGEMLDLIYANRIVDVSLLYNNTTDMQGVLNSVFSNDSAFTYASVVATKEESIRSALDSVFKAIIAED